MTIRVLLADDHQLMREGLALALGNYPDITIIGEAVNGEDALAQVALLHPDVLLLDVFMPVLDGLTVARRMRMQHPDVSVVVLTMDNDETDLRQLRDAQVAGLVMKDAHSSAVVHAIRAAQQHEPSLHPTVLIHPPVTEVLRPVMGGIGATFDLSARERQILCQLARGLSNKQIARVFGLSEKTVRNHLHHIFGKMAVEDRTQAVILALRYELCSDASADPERMGDEPGGADGSPGML